MAVVFGGLLLGNVLRKTIPFFRYSLIPTSVLGGIILLIFAGLYRLITGDFFFETAIFNYSGSEKLEIITYHALALGFIASAFKTNGGKLNKKRTAEIFNTGVTTVSTYLIQAIFGLGITMVIALILTDFFPAAGVLLPFGYGQGTGQAMNYGNIYEIEHGFDGGKSFGLAIAALGFLSAAIGGVIHLNIMKRRGKLKLSTRQDGSLYTESVDANDEIPLQESIDKMTVQIALIIVAYFVAYLLMFFLGNLLPGMRSVIYGFNFLLGVLSATLIKSLLNVLRKKNIIQKKYTNNFLMTRASNFFFDIMVVSGIAVIRLDILKDYWGILLILGISGAIITYIYNRIVAKTLFGDYMEEQFLAMYGMLTGTASTGIILLREIDGDFRTPASDNLVYQNFPAIAFGFPMMFLATLAPVKPILTMIIFVVFFTVMNIILFREQIFRKRRKKQ
jgi:ESS family glutamate:Na+ symporter